MRLRALHSGDADALKAFRCSDGSPAQNEVETYVQRKLLGWFRSSKSNEVLVMEDDADSGDLAGVSAFEPDGPHLWFIKLCAVRGSFQGRGLGQLLLESTLVHIEGFAPGDAVYWKVNVDNQRSIDMSNAIGAEPDPKPASGKLFTYMVRLGGLGPEAPIDEDPIGWE